MSSFMQTILIFLETKGTSIIVSMVAMVFGILIINNFMKIIKMAVIDSKLEKSMVKLVLTIIQFLMYFLLMIYILSKMGIGITGIVAAFSAFSLALGLAVQDVIAGLANGLVLVSTRPFKVGDTVDIAGIYGTIKETNLMHTVIDTPDMTHIHLPNKTVYNSLIQNYSTNPQRRLDYDFGIDYDTDIEFAEKTFLDWMQKNPLVLKSPAPCVKFLETADNSINVRMRMWVMNEKYWDLYWDVRKQSILLCNQNGIQFPFPQVTLSQRAPLTTTQAVATPVETKEAAK